MERIRRFLKTYWFVSLAIASIIVLGIYFIFFSSSNTSSTTTQIEKIVTVSKGDIRVTISGSGQVEADSQVDLKSVVAGDAIEVTTVAVKNDQEVKRGQIIAVLDNQDAWRDVAKAELDLRQAQIKEKQAEDLYPKLDQDDARQRRLASAVVAQSEIGLQKVRDRLQDYTVRAPFDGIVTGLSVSSGDTISQTGILASVITKKLRVAIVLNEVDAAKVNTGSKAELSFDALPGTVVSGTLTKLDTIGTVQQNVVSFGAEIELDDQPVGLRTGMSASAEIIVAEKSGVLAIPNGALTVREERTTVMLASGENGARGGVREVVTGLADDTQVEVISGLKEEDRLIILSGTTFGGSSSSGSTGQSPSLLNLFRGPSGGNQSRSR
ncbi:MAG: efflux RND transporter periplasmic adaptor subunit [Candidatus Moraniibacteriota bacterium]